MPILQSAQINIGLVDSPGAFMNFMKGFQSFIFGSTTPAQYDINGYPITTLASNSGSTIFVPSGMIGNSVTVVAKWPATRPITFGLNGQSQTITNCFTTPTCSLGTNNTEILGGGGASCTTVDPLLGMSCRVELNFNGVVGNQIGFIFPSGANNYASGTGDLILIRKCDEAAYDTGGASPSTCSSSGFGNSNTQGIFTPEFIALVKGLNPKTIRPMSWASVNNSNEVDWRYRTTTSSLSYQNFNYPPNVWAGGPGTAGSINCPGASVDCSSDVYTASDASDTPGSITNGEVIQGIVNFGNATTTPTLNVGTRGAKQIRSIYGEVLTVGDGACVTSVCAGPATFVYNSVLNAYIYTFGGIQSSVPVEVQVALANAVQANLWTDVPAWALDSYVTNWASTILSKLNSPLEFHPEYSNEVWNTQFGFAQTQWATQVGLAMGWPIGNGNEPYHDWYALRQLQIEKLVTTAWSGSTSRLKRVMALQISGDTATTNTYRLQGADLNGATYPTYCAYVGGSWSGGVCTGDPLYNTSPNRPIDNSQVMAYAPYFNGYAFNSGFGNYAGQTAYGIALLQTMATDYASGGSGITTAEALLDNDIRYPVFNSQTVTFAGSTLTVSGTDSFSNGNLVTLSTTGALPSPGNVTTPYYVINNNTGSGTLQLAAASGGSAISFSGGSGTHSIGQNAGGLVNLYASLYGSNNNTYQGWQNVITANGYNVTVEGYEGGLQMLAPTSAQCTSMGITAPPLGGGSPTAAGCSAQLSALLSTYLNDPNYGAPLVLSHFKQFMGTDATAANFGLVPASKTPSWFNLSGPSEWSLCAGTVPSAACYQTYNGFAAFH